MKICDLLSTAWSAATILLLLMHSSTNARGLGRHSLIGGSTSESSHIQHRALIDETKCIGTSKSRLNAGARCALLEDYFYADTDCLYQYQDFHEYFCPCEGVACEPGFTTSQFCTDFLDSKCATGLDDCRTHVDKCCPFPSRCPSQAEELKLFAKYEWQYEAEDTSGSSPMHNGTLDTKAKVRNGKLFVRKYDGVEIGKMAELEGALKMLVRFENVTFYNPDGKSFHAVLAGGGNRAWWVGVDTAFERTALKFNMGGERGWSADMPSEKEHTVRVKVADEVITQFDSIEFSFDGTADSHERIAIRYNDGNWTLNGWPNSDHFRSLPPASSIRINDSYRTDWDPFEAEFGTISFFSSKTI